MVQKQSCQTRASHPELRDAAAGPIASPSETAERAALLRYMRYWSEERWCASWRVGLEHALASLGDGFDSGAFVQLVERAGGWWAWDELQARPTFVEGSYSDL